MMHGRTWDFDPRLCIRVYRPEYVPDFDIRALPPHVKITIPPDGGFWLVNSSTGIRYRRITMADLPEKASWANGMSRKRGEEEDDEND